MHLSLHCQMCAHGTAVQNGEEGGRGFPGACLAHAGDVKEFGFRELAPEGDAPSARAPPSRASAHDGSHENEELPALHPVPVAAGDEVDPRLALTIGVSGKCNTSPPWQLHGSVRLPG